MKRTISIILALCILVAGLAAVLPSCNWEHSTANKARFATRATLIVGSGQAYTKIQAACDAASSGDTILIYNGTYYEHPFLNKTLTLIGNGSANSIIDGSNTGTVLTVNAKYCNLTRLSIRRGNPSWASGWPAAVYIKGNYTTIKYCDISKTCVGVYWTGNYGLVSNINASNCSYDVYMTTCKWNTLANSTFTYAQWSGLYINSCNNATAYNNTFRNLTSSWSFYLSSSQYCNVLFNRNTNASLYTLSGWSNTKCTISNNTDFGISFSTSSNYNLIANNTCRGPTTAGITLSSSRYNTLKGNKYNGDGITLSGWSVQDWNTDTIDATNTVNGKPVYYLKNAVGGSIPGGSGQVILANCQGVSVKDQSFCNLTNAVSIGYGNSNTVANISVKDLVYYGVYLSNSNSNTITNITSVNASSAVLLYYSLVNKVSKCNISSSRMHGISLSYSNNNEFSNNTIRSVKQYGVDLGMSTGSNKVIYNRLENNVLYGVSASSWSSGNQIHHNTVIGTWNTMANDLSTTNRWNASNIGNYWSDWLTPDSDRDGIVDVPRVITGSNNDYYPLAVPFGTLRIKTTDVTSATEDQLYSVNYEIYTKIEPILPVTWSMKTSAPFLIFDGTNTLTGTPNNSHYGNYWVNISVNNGLSMDFHNFTLTAVNTNDLPVITTLDNLTAIEDRLYSVQYAATDPDPVGNALTWSMSTNASFLSLSNSGLLSGTPTNTMVGTYHVNVTINDGLGGLDWSAFTLTVLNTNDPPEITSANVAQCNEDAVYAVQYSAQDLDPTADVLAWSMRGNAAFLTMSAQGLMSGIPSNADVGAHWVNVTVSDGKGGNDCVNFTLTVLNINDPPTPVGISGEIEFPEDTTYSGLKLSDRFLDPDGDDLTFTFTGNQNIFILVLPNSSASFTPKANWSGQEVVTFYANDSKAQASWDLSVIVEPVNDAPQGAVISLEARDYREGGPQPVWGNATDADIPFGDELTYIWSTNSTTSTWTGRSINLSLPAGYYLLTLTVRDIMGLNSTAVKEIRILPKPVTPIPVDDDVDDDIDDDVDDDIDDDVDDDIDDDDDTGSNLASIFIVLGILFVVIVLIAVAIFMYLRSKKHSDEDAPPPTTHGEVLEAEVEEVPDLAADVERLEKRKGIAKPYQKPVTTPVVAPISPAPAPEALPPMSEEPPAGEPPKAVEEETAPVTELTAELPEEDINIDDEPEMEGMPDAQAAEPAKGAAKRGGEDSFWSDVKPVKK